MLRRVLIGASLHASVLTLGLGPLLDAHAVNLPPGWQQQPGEGMSTFTPKTAQGRHFSLMLSDPLPMNGHSLNQWAEEAVNNVSGSYGKVVRGGKPDKQGALWTVKHEVEVQGQRFTAIYHAFSPTPGKARLSIMLGEPALFERHAPEAASIIASALAEGDTQASRQTGKRQPSSGPQNRQGSTSTHPEEGAASSRASTSPNTGSQHNDQRNKRFAFSAHDIQTVLNHAETTYGVYGLEVEETTQVLLKDGRLYTNGKANGQWRRHGGRYQYRRGSADGKPTKGWQNLPGDPVQGISAKTLPGYFNADRGHSFGTTVAVTRNRIEFLANGRYETDHHFSGYTQMGDAITTPQTTTAISSSKGARQGRYRILNQYALELTEDNGQVRQVIAYFSDKKRKWLNLNETAYQRK